MSNGRVDPLMRHGEPDDKLAKANIGARGQVPAGEAMLKEASFDRGGAGECKSEDRNLIPKIDANKEFAISGLGLHAQFVIGQNKTSKFIKTVIKADPKAHQQDFIEVSIGKEKFRFERRLNGTQLVWSFPLSERERLAVVMEWELINGERISAPSLDDSIEFAISGLALQAQFAINQEKTSKFIKTVIKADPKTHQQDFIEVNIKGEEFQFERRLNGKQIVWSLPLSERERLAGVMGWRLQTGARISAPKLNDSIEFAMSVNGLRAQFVNGQKNAPLFIRAFITNDPKTHHEDFIKVSIGEEKFRLERRLNGKRLVWSLPLSERERLAGVMEWKLIDGERISAPSLDDSIEFAISELGLQAYFALDREKTSKFIKTVIKADPKTHQQDFIEVSIGKEKFRFDRRMNGTQLAWSLLLSNRERLAGIMEWELQNGERISAPKLDKFIEFAISRFGLQAQFINGESKAVPFLKTVIIADPKTHQEDFIEVDIKNESFRFERRLNGPQLVWSLPLNDRERLARTMNWKLKNRRLQGGGNLATLAAQIQAITKHAQDTEKRVNE